MNANSVALLQKPHSRAYEVASRAIDRLFAQEIRRAPHPKEVPAPVPAAPSTPPRWEPCCRYGGTRVCPSCERDAAELASAVEGVSLLSESLPELKPVAGTMAKAEAMWRSHHKFVRSRCWAELRKYHEPDREMIGDLEQEVWATVAQKIGQYQDQGLKHGPLAWLKTVVFSVTNNHVRDKWRECRDDRKAIHGLPSDDILTQDPTDAKPIRPDGSGPDTFEVDQAAAYQDAVSR